MTNTEFRIKFRDLMERASEDNLPPEALADIIDSEFANRFPNEMLPRATHPCPPEPECTDTDQITDAMHEIAHELNFAGRMIAYAIMRHEMSPQTIQHELDRLGRGKEG